MAEKIQEKPGVFAPQNKQLSSYVISITFPQPVIRIKIPNLFVKAIQRRNQSTLGEKGSKTKTKTKHHHRATSKKSFKNKVGSVISTVFGKKKSAETDPPKGENSTGVDEEMKKLKDMIESVDMGSEKITGKSADDQDNLVKDGVQPVAVAAERAIVVKERPKSRRTYPKRKDQELNKAKVSNVEDTTVAVGNNNTDSSVACVGDKGPKTVLKQDSIVACAGDKGPKTVLKHAENSGDLTRFKSKTMSSNGKPKIGRSIKRVGSALVGGKSEKQELCKKKILMGVRCKPLSHSGIIQYDKNGFLVPDIVP